MTTPKRVLHGFKLSGHAHRAKLFLSILRLPHEEVEVDLPHRAHKAPDFLSMNPFGQVPVLVDGDVTIADSNAILVYLALKYDTGGTWYPTDPVIAASIQRWLSVAAGELAFGPAAARRAALFGAPVDREQATAAARSLFEVMDRQLASSRYLAGDAPTIADLSLYSYTAVANEGGISLEGARNVRAWLERVESLAGFVPMHRSQVA